MNFITRLLTRRKPRLTIVVATRNDEALAALAAVDTGGVTLEQREAFTTSGVYDTLPGAHLVIVDLPDLVETGGVNREQLATTLITNGGAVPHADGKQFAADPDTWLETARAALGVPAALPPRRNSGYGSGIRMSPPSTYLKIPAIVSLSMMQGWYGSSSAQISRSRVVRSGSAGRSSGSSAIYQPSTAG